ncbi:MAG TPA: integrase, partial [Burkholderiaceae bacterium]|nr:integrase [Burkholderiaceae bacterium]
MDPNAKRDAQRIEEREQIKATLVAEERRRAEDASVRELCDLWLRDGVLRKDSNAALARSFEADVLPTLGAMPVRAVTEHDVRAVLRGLVGRGVNRTAVEVHRNIKQMFRWAEKRQP